MIVRHSLPLHLVDQSEFRDLLSYAGRLGEERIDVGSKIPSRRTLVRRVICGSQGLLAEKVQEVLKGHHEASQFSGSSIVFDSVTDVNRAQIVNVIVESSGVKSVLASVRVGPQRTTASFYLNMMEDLLRKSLDHVALDAKAAELAEDHEERPSSDQAAATKEVRKLLELCDRVYAVGSDNASNVQLAIRQAEDEHGILGFGC